MSKLDCVVCAGVATDKIDKNENFCKMMALYWEGIEVDVKPMDNTKMELCVICFEEMKGLYETNDICLYFERHMKEARSSLLGRNLKGIMLRQENNLPMPDVLFKITERWGTKLEPDDSDAEYMKGFHCTTYLEDSEDSLSGSKNIAVQSNGNKHDAEQSSKRAKVQNHKTSGSAAVQNKTKNSEVDKSPSKNLRKRPARKGINRKSSKRALREDESSEESSISISESDSEARKPKKRHSISLIK